MKYIRLSLFFALVACLLLSVSPAAFAAEEGTCGPNATWRFEGGTLTISGTGPVTRMDWAVYQDYIVRVVVEPGITSLPPQAFFLYKYLTNVTLPEGFTTLNEFAFYACMRLSTVHMPSTLTDIGNYAFYGCETLKNITLPNSLVSMGSHAFENCTALSSVVLPQSLTVVPAFSFQGCKNLESVTLSPNTTHIEADAFGECSSLRSITLPATIQSLHGLPSTLQEIHISDLAAWCTAKHASRNHYLEHAGLYLNGELITDLVIPEGCSSISYSAFYGYKWLTSVTFPEGLTSIGGNAFENCTSLKQVTLPSTIQHIGNYAFSNATALHQVFYNGSTDDLNKISIFSGNDNLLNASWKFSSIGSIQIYIAIYRIILPLACLLQLGVLIACLVIYIRQRKYFFL